MKSVLFSLSFTSLALLNVASAQAAEPNMRDHVEFHYIDKQGSEITTENEDELPKDRAERKGVKVTVYEFCRTAGFGHVLGAMGQPTCKVSSKSLSEYIRDKADNAVTTPPPVISD